MRLRALATSAPVIFTLDGLGHSKLLPNMLAFEKLAYFATGIRCEPSPRGIAIRVALGLVATSASLGLSLVFAGAGAGNSNSTGSFMSLLLPVAAIYGVYFVLTLVILGKGWQQAAQYVSWSPLLLLVAALGGGLLFSFRST